MQPAQLAVLRALLEATQAQATDGAEGRGARRYSINDFPGTRLRRGDLRRADLAQSGVNQGTKTWDVNFRAVLTRYGRASSPTSLASTSSSEVNSLIHGHSEKKPVSAWTTARG